MDDAEKRPIRIHMSADGHTGKFFVGDVELSNIVCGARVILRPHEDAVVETLLLARDGLDVVLDGVDLRALIVQEPGFDWPSAELEAAVNRSLDVVLRGLQADPHVWSSRPCGTCQTISTMLARSFGCVRYAEERAAMK